ncbi:MAG: exodeoxyribonuclease VII small subunit [Dorea sp.]
MDKGEQNLQEQTLEELFVQLEETMKKMEQEDVSLEDSFRYYHRGMDLLKVCNDKIDQVEKKMLVLDEEGETHEF